MLWHQTGSVIIGTTPQESQSHRRSIAAFDFDGTLTLVQGSHVHAKNANDWKLFHPSIPERLRSLHQDGYRLVIFSNQQGISEAKNLHRKQSFIGRVENFVKSAIPDLPLIVYAATRDDGCRKPCPGMWNLFEKHHAEPIEKCRSFYVGDAAGRPAGHKPGARKDFSDSDLKFAFNIGITFATPESFFLNGGVINGEFELQPAAFSPSKIIQRDETEEHAKSTQYRFESFNKDEPELVLMVGSPACGKSTFAKKNFVRHGYIHVNQDQLKTKEKCLKMVEDALQGGKRVVVDNTNPTREVRALYIQAAARTAKRTGRSAIPVRCVFVLADPIVCKHNNVYRAYMANRDSDGIWMQKDSETSSIKSSSRGKIPDIAFRSFSSRFEEPTAAEGFTEVLKVAFSPAFETEEEKKLWCMYWT